jgi:hypothetical protein
MTDAAVATRPEEIPPGEPDLITLAEQINSELEAFKSVLLSTAERAFVVGGLLLRAKELVERQLGPGHWLEWLADRTSLPDRTAQRWMAMAGKEAELRAKYPDLSKLTITGKLRLIEELKDPDDKSCVTRQGANKPRKSPVDKAIERDALDILKRAWRKCNEEQRDAFRQELAG